MEHRSLRVLHILGELRPSGAETMLVVGAQQFAEHGVMGEVLGTGRITGAFATQLRAAGYLVHHVPFARSPLFFARVFRMIRGRYDVIHIHMERASFWVGIVARCSGASIIVRTVHNAFSFGGLLRIRRKLQRRLLAFLGVRYVAVGQSVRENEASRFGVPAVLIENWCDTTRFRAPDVAERRAARERLAIGDHEMAIVSVGNCGPAKNHAALLAALKLLPPESRPLYLHVGEEEPGHPERAQAEAFGVADHVRFVGRLDDVRPVLHAADAFVMPSFYEGFSIAAIEALATGLPAVLSDVPGLKDCRPHFGGIVYANPEPHSLAKALQAVLALRDEDRRRIGLGNLKIARAQFSPQRGVDEYVRLYRNGSGVGKAPSVLGVRGTAANAGDE